MSQDDGNKWAKKDMSPSCSSFEGLDPHDPVLSRLATLLFRKTKEYLQGEMSAGQDIYNLLEELNRQAITKNADLRNLVVTMSKTINDYVDGFNMTVKPLLDRIEEIDAEVSLFEVQAYRLDAYTKQLKKRFKELEEK